MIATDIETSAGATITHISFEGTDSNILTHVDNVILIMVETPNLLLTQALKILYKIFLLIYFWVGLSV